MIEDVFLSIPTIDGSTIFSAIYDYDQNATDEEKAKANLDLLNGDYNSECSNAFEHFGTFVTNVEVDEELVFPKNDMKNEELKNSASNYCFDFLNVVLFVFALLL